MIWFIIRFNGGFRGIFVSGFIGDVLGVDGVVRVVVFRTIEVIVGEVGGFGSVFYFIRWV